MGSRYALKINTATLINLRNFATQRFSQEVQIPIPGGYVAGKWWGPEDKRPILAFHGWQDNAGSFDRLIPLLPPHIPILALDFLGHGFSSQIPPGMAYHNIDQPIMIKRVKQYFGWDKVSLMGHSMGGILAFTYGYLFPNDVDFLICIDRLYPLLTPAKDKGNIAKNVEMQIKYDQFNNTRKEPPSYAFEEMVKKMNLATKKSVDIEVAKYILYRNIAPSRKYPGKFYFNRDARLKVGPLQYQDPVELLRVAAKITCPLFVCKAEESLYFGRDPIIDQLGDILTNSSTDFQFHNMPGTHHSHLNNPEILAGLLTDFLLKHDTQDRINGGLKPEVKVDESVYPVYQFKQQILEDDL